MKKSINKIFSNIVLFSACASVLVSVDAQESVDDKKSGYIEEITVRGVAGDVNSLEHSMTVTGFNESMIDELGINNNNDLEMLTPGLQIGHESPDSGHGNHIYLRGIGSERHQEFFQDTAVATYVDGIYTDSVYGLEQGNLFDIERIEVARGPQGTQGGRSAIAGSIHYDSKRPSEVFDTKVLAEFTDQTSQRYEVAFGGPIGDSGFMYRVRAGKWDGDGKQKNVGPGGDYDAPDQFSITPQLRYLNDSWDINLSWTHTEDKGAPRSSVGLTPRDVTTECFNFGTTASGETVCVDPNPSYNSQQQPSVAGCNPTPGSVICDAGSLRNEVDFNTVGYQDSELDNIGFDAAFKITDNLTLSYKYGYRESLEDALTDVDKTSRTIGGICPDPANQSDYCSLDGFGLIPAGGYQVMNYSRYQEQSSHELTLISDFDGQFNFVAGLYARDGDEPYVASSYRYGQEGMNVDGFEACTGEGGRSQSLSIGQESMPLGYYFSCPGTPEDQALAEYSNVPGVVKTMTGNLNGSYVSFFGHTAFETQAAYFNGDWSVNDQWKVLGGIRYDVDTRTHEQNDASIGYSGTNSITGEPYGYNLWIFRNANVPTMDWKRDKEWSEVTWTIGVEHYPTDGQMFYARISKGARAGGFAGFGQYNEYPWGTFDSETLINYELGLKGLFFDEKLQLESAIFFMDYKDHWVNAERLKDANERFAGESLFEGEMNVIQGTWIGGLELSGAYTLTDTVTIRGFYAYLDAEVGNFSTVYCCDETAPTVDVDFTLNNGTTITEQIKEPVNFGGNRLPLMSKHKYALTALWSPKIPTGSLTLLGTYAYTGTRHPDLSNIARFELPSYTRVDLRAIWDSPDEDYSVTLYVKNVLDEIAVQQFRPIETGSGSTINGSLTDEREFGMSVMWQIF